MKDKTRLIAAAIAAAMALTCASCSLLPGGGAKKEDIVDAADTFAKALVSCDTDKIVKLTNEDKKSDTVEELEAHLNGLLYSVEQDQIAEAVADTLEYEIDEDSVEIKKDEASVDVTFTMVDYEAALGDGEFADADEAVNAIKDCDDTTEVEVTFEFAKEDDEWLISNLGDKAYSKLYGFYGLDVSFMPDLEELIADEFIAADYGYLYMTVTFSEDITDYVDGITYDVFLDGELVYGDQEPYSDNEQIWGSMSVDGPLENGKYTVVFYYNGIEFASDSIDVDNSNSGVISVDPVEIEGDVYLCYADCTDAFTSQLDSDGFDLELEGTIGIWIELTMSDDGEYVITVDGNTFGADLIDFFTENKDQIMMGFLGVSSIDELYEYEESLGSDSYDVLESTMIQAFVSEYSAAFSELYDYGTYTVSGDTIYYTSNDFSDFEGTLGDDMITIDTGDTSLNSGEPLEFYPEG
ncbi:MAG: hypothetical protein IK128_01960 [Clostridiales bacterium]|nr:hypothetical protein [Clostridiales bacterium]